MTKVFFPPGFEQLPEPGIVDCDGVRGNGVIDILGWLNNFAVGFFEPGDGFLKNIMVVCIFPSFQNGKIESMKNCVKVLTWNI